MFKLTDAFWNLIGKFLLSPWGLILPMTGLALLLLSMQLEKLPTGLTETYAQRLVDCPESEVNEVVDAIVRLGDLGLPALVGGLRSEREAVFFACRNALQQNLDHWATQRESVQNEHYRRLTELLLWEIDNFKMTAQVATAEFVDRILRETARHQGTDAGNSVAVSANCEQLLDRIQTTQQRMFAPNDSSTAPTSDSIVRLHRSTLDPMLLAAEDPANEGQADLPHVDEFALPRAELLYAYHRSPTYQQQSEMPYRRPGLTALPPGVVPERSETQGEMIASMGQVRQTPWNDAFAPAETQGKVANRFEPEPELNIGNIAENYIAESPRHRPLDQSGRPFRAESMSVNESDDLLPEELKRIRPEKIPSLPTTKLMQLLQHADDRIVTAARQTLIGRDGFQDAHLKLAFQLYHPLPTIRSELVGQLPGISGIQQSVWLTELMNDPNADVRYLAASALATASDPAMQRLLADRGKRDTDPRIVALAERMIERRRKTR